MNRRILLIDADQEFYARLSDLFGRYRIDIVFRPDPDEAIADGAIEVPALIVLAVDEPDKAGFKTFQTLKKGPLAKLPIVLVTRSVAPSAMQKHNGLKTHADAYLDKRTLSDDELIGRVDNLIALGDPSAAMPVVELDSSLDIPLEVDDLAVGHDEMVLEETVGDDDDYDPDNQTVAGRSEAVDQMVAAETDAAFDALLGFGDEPAAPSVAERLAAADSPDAAPQVIEDSPLEPVAPVEAAPAEIELPEIVDEAAPQAVEAREPSDVFDTFSRESPRGTISAPNELATPEPAPQPVAQLDVVEAAVEHGEQFESQPAILLDADDLLIEDDFGEELGQEIGQEIEQLEDSGGVPEPVPHVNLVHQDYNEMGPPAVADSVPEVQPVLLTAPEPEPTPARVRAASEPPTRAPSEPQIIPPARAARTTNPPAFDLGLDEVAADAENEQSGIYDRKSLRKIGELERQLAQLKTELERARATAGDGGASRSSREREFLNLREQLTGKDAEVRKATGERDAKAREVDDLEDRLRQLQQLRSASEARLSELEQRAAADGARLTALTAKESHLAAQVASMQSDLETRAHALAASEAAKAQLERDLTTERATRAASASDAERALRIEREQMIARHQGELSQLRVEHAGAQAAAIEKLRQDLTAEQTTALEAAHAEQAAALEVARKQAAAAVEAVRSETAAEAEQASARVHADHAGELQRLRDDHAASLARLAEERDAALARAAAEHTATLERTAGEQAAARESAVQLLRDDHVAALARIAADHDAQQAELAAAREQAISELAGELERVQNEHLAERTALTAARDQALAAHAAELARLKGEHATEAAALAVARDQAVAEVYAELQQVEQEQLAERAAHATALDKAVAEATAALERAHAEAATVRAAHAESLAHQAQKHAAELAEQANQHAAAMTAREAELVAQRQDEAIAHTAALAELKVELDRQAAQHGIKLDGAKRELDDVLALHQQAQARLAEDHAKVATDQAAAHAAELASLAAEKQAALDDIAKAQADHKRALADAAAQHAAELAAVKELGDREVAELKSVLVQAKRTMEETAARHQAERDAAEAMHLSALAEAKAGHERALAVASGETIRVKAVADAEHQRAMAARDAELDKERKATAAEHGKVVKDLTTERDDLQRGLSAARDTIKRSEGELAAAVQTIADRNAELRGHAAAIAERDARISELRKELESLEAENSSYQDQVLRAYQKIKSDEVMVARAKKAMAIALTVLDEDPKPKADA